MVFLIELWILTLNFIGGFSTQFFPVRKSLNNCSTDAATREEIEGAELKVIDEDGNVIDEWTSTKEPHKVVGLEENKKIQIS